MAIIKTNKRKTSPTKKPTNKNSQRGSINRSAVLINLGSPLKPTVGATRRYLREFLMDKYVIDIPFIFRAILVCLIIAPFRSLRSSKSYQKIWQEKESPLIASTKKLSALVQANCQYPVSIAMRYSSPSILTGLQNALKKLPNQTAGAYGEIYCVPLYPHYAMSTTQTVTEKMAEVFSNIKQKNPQYKNISLHFKKAFYAEKNYIEALCKSIAPQAAKLGKKDGYDLLIFSYHGIPIRHLHKTDSSKSYCYKVENCCSIANKVAHKTCYKHQCYETTNSVIKHLKLNPKNTSTTFQSRLGRDPWITPYTDLTIQQLPQKGIKKVLVCSPAFVSDNLETLFELHHENREFFMEAGGEKFDVIPCLNLQPLWVRAISQWVNNAAE